MEELKRLFYTHGKTDYIGEDVTQLEHALQAADAAMNAGEPLEMQLAALTHDIGHLLMLDGQQLKSMEANGHSLGAHNHAEAGADWLEQVLHVGHEVTDLVRYHVEIKRYLATVIPDYVETCLSEASKETLKLQGGPMTVEEVQEFESMDINISACIRLRDYDNAAKIKGKQTSTLESILVNIEPLLY